MTKTIDVYPLPSLVDELPDSGVCVAIDVLRATTTITTALANGALRVLPFETVEETFAAKRAILAARPEEEGKILLGGERGGLPIDGFDLGNSPDLYAREEIEGKTLLFTTTNGTKAILRARGKRLLASFLNVDAVVKRILDADFDSVSIICAGTNGQYTQEDLLLAGCLVDKLTLSREGYALNVQAEVSREDWRTNRSRPLAELLRESTGGQNLSRLKLGKDIIDAARMNALDVVAEYRLGEIRLDSCDWKN